MIEFQAVERRLPENNNWCNLKEHMVADLLGLRPVWIKDLPPPPKSQKRTDDLDGVMPQFKTIRTLKNWYIVQSQERHILVTEVLPNPQCYQFNFRVAPIDVHILNSQVYFLTSHTSIAMASLKNSNQPTEQAIPQLGKVYGMYSGYRPQVVEVHSQLNMIIKILHWNRGLEVYELGSETTGWFSNIMKMIGEQLPYERVLIIQPDVLGCAMAGESVQLIDLATKRPIGHTIKISKLFNSCALRVSTFHRPVFLQSRQPGQINFILAFYIADSNNISLYHVKIPLAVSLGSIETVYLDQLVGNILLGNTAEISLMCELHLPEGKIKIKDVKMSQNGIISVYTTDSYEEKLDADLRPWRNIINRKFIDVLDHGNDIAEQNDQDFSDVDELRNRITAPGRFPHNLLVRQLHNVYGCLATKSPMELIRIAQSLSASWRQLYKFRQLIEFDNYLFLVRQNGVSILSQRSDEQDYHYLTYVRPNLKRQQMDMMSLGMSRMSISQPTQHISHVLDSAVHNLHRLKISSKLTIIYDRALRNIRDKLETTTNWVSSPGRTSSIVVNLILSKVRSMLKVFRELLPRLYPQSERDISQDDITVISIMCYICSIVHHNYELYSIIRNVETCFVDLASMLISKMPLTIDSLHVHNDMTQSLFQKICHGLISFGSKIPFSKENQLLTEAIALAKDDIKYYANYIVECQDVATTLQVIQCCIFARKVDSLRDRLFMMQTHQFKDNYEVLRQYLRDTANRDWNHTVCKAKAILQAVRIKSEPCSIAAHSLAVMVPDDACKKMVKMLSLSGSSPQIQHEIKQKLAYIKVEVAPVRELNYWLNHLTSTDPNTLSDMHQFYKQLNDPHTKALFYRQLFKLQCILFNRLHTDQVEVDMKEKLVYLLKCMLMTLTKAIEEQSKADSTLDAQTQRNILESHEPLLYDKKIPKKDLLEVLIIAQEYCPGRKAVPWDLVPRGIVSYLLGNNPHKAEIITKALKHFSDRELANEISLRRVTTDRPSEAMSALNYSFMSYCNIAKEEQQYQQLFRLMLQHKIRRDLERQSGFM